MKSLSDTANGTITGKARIMLETYIQMQYPSTAFFARANIRLMTMSSGQYELVRRKENKSRVGKTGLELDVVDHYNGTVRSVKTLSGGETFQASLSLALGLLMKFSQAPAESSLIPCLWMKVSDLWMKMLLIRQSAH